MGLIKAIKNRVRDGVLHRWHCRRMDNAVLKQWESLGRPQPPPQPFKRRIIRDIAAQFGTRVLVETGTNYGDTVAASLGSFDTIHTIELYDPLFEAAVRRFARRAKVRLYNGDSATVLPRILDELREPALFWLDAHYSGDGTARAAIDTPIVQELQTISQHPVLGHVILIDDARCFDGTNDYPTLDSCRLLATQFWPSHKVTVEDDIIRITPQETKRQ